MSQLLYGQPNLPTTEYTSPPPVSVVKAEASSQLTPTDTPQQFIYFSSPFTEYRDTRDTLASIYNSNRIDAQSSCSTPPLSHDSGGFNSQTSTSTFSSIGSIQSHNGSLPSTPKDSLSFHGHPTASTHSGHNSTSSNSYREPNDDETQFYIDLSEGVSSDQQYHQLTFPARQRSHPPLNHPQTPHINHRPTNRTRPAIPSFIDPAIQNTLHPSQTPESPILQFSQVIDDNTRTSSSQEEVPLTIPVKTFTIENRKRTRKALTLGEKAEIIEFVKHNPSTSILDFSRQRRLARSTIYGILNNADKIMELARKQPEMSRVVENRFRILEELLVDWSRMRQASNVQGLQGYQGVVLNSDHRDVTTKIVQSWLINFDRDIGRKVVLLVDEVMWDLLELQHGSSKNLLRFTTVIPAPKSLASSLPMNARIIRDFKTYYYTILLKNKLRWREHVESQRSVSKASTFDSDVIRVGTILHVNTLISELRIIPDAWLQVSTSVIENDFQYFISVAQDLASGKHPRDYYPVEDSTVCENLLKTALANLYTGLPHSITQCYLTQCNEIGPCYFLRTRILEMRHHEDFRDCFGHTLNFGTAQFASRELESRMRFEHIEKKIVYNRNQELKEYSLTMHSFRKNPRGRQYSSNSMMYSPSRPSSGFF
ncbi:hypothetical protein BGZ46_007871 [Entomortierella lignicola]|nr:hypothetical protein BGZ46_007871 [Entomortierella lignicola]